MVDLRIEASWKKVLGAEFDKPYLNTLHAFLGNEYRSKIIVPPLADVFAAFRETPWERVRVVIVGQDPYHGTATREVRCKKGEVRLVQVPQAMGLCFSVRDGVPPPPSLQNIFREVAYEKAVHSSGDLTHWARQGVLLLNSVLTVEAGKARSHAGKGWEQFTDAVIQKISQEKEGVVFLLWGNYARSKKHLIDTKKHLVLEAPHPSPLSAYAGFFGCGHFTKVNDYLRSRGEKEIEW